MSDIDMATAGFQNRQLAYSDSNRKAPSRYSLLMLILLVFSTACFNSTCSILNIQHLSSSFRAYSVAVSAVSFLVVLTRVIFGLRLSRLSLLCIAVTIVEILSFFIAGYGNASAMREFQYFCLWGVSSLFAGMVFSTEDNRDYLIKCLDIIWVLLTAGSAAYIVRAAIGQWIAIDESGMSYQAASYYAALAYGINIYTLFYWKDNCHKRFTWANTHLFKVISQLCIPIQLLIVFYSGGRGGLLEAAVFTLLALVAVQIVKKSPLLSILIVACSAIAVVLAIRIVLSGETSLGLWRLSAASGRQTIFSDSLRLIGQRPMFGYGFFGYIQLLGNYRYPHNIFLQLMLSCGISGTLILLGLFMAVLSRIKYLPKSHAAIVVVLLVDCLIRLLVSGSFLYDTSLLFSIGYLANSNNASPHSFSIESSHRNI